ncbi:PAS domain-containing sensor histidine kinase [Haloferax sp. DFSO52]|uniref:PAS domain-containing sensor histidine kinase n=1 Tax=Haloferax sp. DFSO52 TaxID=3388505 RepID=UPI003A84EF44
MSESRVFLVGEDASLLCDALERRGFAVETVARRSAVFETLDGPVKSVVVDGRSEAESNGKFVSRLRDHVGAVPVYLVVDDPDYITPTVLGDDAIGVHRSSVVEDTEAFAARVECAIEFFESVIPGESDSLYRTIVEQSHDAIFVAQDGDVRFCNHRLAELTGHTDDELVGKTVLDIIHPDDRQRVSEISERRRRGDDAPESYEVRVVGTDDEVRQCSANVQSIEIHGEYGVLVTLRDVTEQRTYESQLHHYETIVESIQQGAYVVDRNFVLQYINEPASDRTSMPRDTLIGKHISVFREHGILPEDQYSQFVAGLENILAGESTGERFELDVSLASGEYVIDFTITPIHGTGGEITGAVGLSSDITARKRYEERLNALHVSTRQLSAATSKAAVLDGVCEAAVDVLDYDLCGVLLYDDSLDALVPTKFTEQAEELFGDVPPLPRGTGLAWEVFESGTERFYEDVGSEPRRYNPRTDIVEELMVPIPEYGVFFVGALTEGALGDQRVALARVLASNARAALGRVEREQLLRQRERELARQNEQLESFASAVSHDLQNPLNIAMGYLELAREEDDSDALQRVANAHERIGTIIQDVLALARNGQTVEEVEQVSLEAVAMQAWKTAAANAPNATLEIVDGDVVIDAHRSRLQQLLENLISNAIRHGGDDVTVRIGPLEDRDGFFVEDDGVGISSSDLPRIFEAGYTTSEKGSGFGLTIVQSVVNAHGWSIWYSDSDEGGARFEITTQSS